MRLLQKTKDGGPDSPVDAFFLIEWKKGFSIALLRFNKGAREAYHTHAFNALTWFLSGELTEEQPIGKATRQLDYKRSLLPKITIRSNNHRVIAHKTSWCFTIRGPWEAYWTETRDDKLVTLTHGRKEVNGPTRTSR